MTEVEREHVEREHVPMQASFEHYLELVLQHAEEPFARKAALVRERILTGDLDIRLEEGVSGVDFIASPVFISNQSEVRPKMETSIAIQKDGLAGFSDKERWMNFGYGISLAADWFTHQAARRKSTSQIEAVELSLGFLQTMETNIHDVVPEHLADAYLQRANNPQAWQDQVKLFLGVGKIEYDPDADITRSIIGKLMKPNVRLWKLFLSEGGQHLTYPEFESYFDTYQQYFTRFFGNDADFKIRKMPIVEYYRHMTRRSATKSASVSQADADREMAEMMLARALVALPLLEPIFRQEDQMRKSKEILLDFLTECTGSDNHELAQKAEMVKKHITDGSLALIAQDGISSVHFGIMEIKDSQEAIDIRPMLAIHPEGLTTADIDRRNTIITVHLSQAADWFSGQYRYRLSEIHATAIALGMDYLDAHGKIFSRTLFPPSLVEAYYDRESEPERWLQGVRDLIHIPHIEPDIDFETFHWELKRYRPSAFLIEKIKRLCESMGWDSQETLRNLPDVWDRLKSDVATAVGFQKIREKHRQKFTQHIEQVKQYLPSSWDEETTQQHVYKIICLMIIEDELENNLLPHITGSLE